MIRFSKMNRADSIVNRILNAADELAEARQQMPAAAPDPVVTSVKGAEIDAALSTPVNAPAAPEGAEESAAIDMLQGADALGSLSAAAVFDQDA